MAATPLNIKDPEAHRLASEIAESTGKSLTRVVVDALRHEKERLTPPKFNRQKIDEILARMDALPDIDSRSVKEIEDEIYDEHGLFRE